MNLKLLGKTIRGIRDSIPGGHLIGRLSSGSGAPEVISLGQIVEAIQQNAQQGGGNGIVSSVAMTGDGVIFDTAVGGSPITKIGTLVPALLTQTAKTALMGPASGSASIPSFRQVTDADLSLSDITTNNVSDTAHGFAPKNPNDATKYLDGTGAYSVPAGSGGGSSSGQGPPGFDGDQGEDGWPGPPGLSGGAGSGISTTVINVTNTSVQGVAVILPGGEDGEGEPFMFPPGSVIPVVSSGGTVTTTGSPASGNLTKFSGAASITNGDLSGDVSTSGTLATTIKTNVALPGSPTTTTQSQNDNSTKIATTAYTDLAVANGIGGVNPAQSVSAATTAAADTSSFVYNNGVSGIGATLTGPTANVAVTIDGFTFTALGQRLLVKNDTQSPSGAFNGVYYVTTLQAPLVKPVLTRALDYDQPSDINSSGAIPVINGTVNALTSWLLTTSVTTVGTSPLTYTQFSFTAASGANPTATASDVAVNGSATTFLRSDGAPAVQKTSSSQFGLCKVDNTTITASGGIISSVASLPGPLNKFLTVPANPGFDPNFAGVPGVTWTISNSNRTALPASSSPYNHIMGTPARYTGKAYYEMVNPDTTYGGVGITGPAGHTWDGGGSRLGASNIPGQIGWNASANIQTYEENNNTSLILQTMPVWSAANRLSIAVDLDNLLIWFRAAAGNWNNSGAANPATGVGGIILSPALSRAGEWMFWPAMNSANTSTACNMYLNTADFTQTVPSGYGSWSGL